jgi:hypothetical protein
MKRDTNRASSPIFLELQSGLSRERKVRLCACCLMFLMLICNQLAYAEGIKLIKAGDHYAPVLRPYNPLIILPQTTIRAGIYEYELDDGPGGGKVGFLNGKSFSFVDEITVLGGVVYAISPPYFLIDATGGGTSRYGYLFLFTFDKAGVKLLDVIRPGSINKWTMETMFNPHQDKPEFEFPALGKIGDVNHDGILEIEVLISTAFHFEPSFMLYFDIAGDKLRLNLDPSLYRSLFDAEKQKATTTRKKSDAFFIYGFLTKNLDLGFIKRALKDDHDRRWIMAILNGVDKWDTAFHNQYGEKITMKELHLERSGK